MYSARDSIYHFWLNSHQISYVCFSFFAHLFRLYMHASDKWQEELKRKPLFFRPTRRRRYFTLASSEKKRQHTHSKWMVNGIAREKRTCMTIYLRVRFEPKFKLRILGRFFNLFSSKFNSNFVCVSLCVSICGNSMGWTRHLYIYSLYIWKILEHTHAHRSRKRNRMATAAHIHMHTNFAHPRQRRRRKNRMRKILEKSAMLPISAPSLHWVANARVYFNEYWIFNIKPKTCMTQIAVHSAFYIASQQVQIFIARWLA